MVNIRSATAAACALESLNFKTYCNEVNFRCDSQNKRFVLIREISVSFGSWLFHATFQNCGGCERLERIFSASTMASIRRRSSAMEPLIKR